MAAVRLLRACDEKELVSESVIRDEQVCSQIQKNHISGNSTQ